MVTVKRTDDFLAHTGKKGMKWGYNDGSRNGRRTAAELKQVANAVAEYQKNADKDSQGTGDVEGDYHEANNMLKYLGITLDLQSDDKKVAETMGIYNQMKNTKDSYKSQHEWLKAFSSKLAKAGYDMAAVDKMLDENKDKLNVMKTGTGTGNREKSNQDWKENDAKKSTNKSSSKKSSSSKSSSKKSETKTSTTKKNTTSTVKKTSTRQSVAEAAAAKKSSSTKKPYNYRPKNTYGGAKKYPSRSKYVAHAEIIQNGDELYHHGILGQKWGVRRYQNPDGSLTSEGRVHYGKSESKYGAAKGKGESAKKYSKKRASKMSDAELDAATNRINKEANYKNASDRLKGKTTKDTLQDIAIATGAAITIAANADKLYKIGKTTIKLGKKAAEKAINKLL